MGKFTYGGWVIRSGFPVADCYPAGLIANKSVSKWLILDFFQSKPVLGASTCRPHGNFYNPF